MKEFTLPWPPSANNYRGLQVILPSVKDLSVAMRKTPHDLWKWLRKNARAQWYLRKEAKDYYWAVRSAVGAAEPIEGPVCVTVDCYPPDRRKRDLGNVEKCVMDALESARVIDDDYQIADLRLRRFDPVQGGSVTVRLEEIPEAQGSLGLAPTAPPSEGEG